MSEEIEEKEKQVKREVHMSEEMEEIINLEPLASDCTVFSTSSMEESAESS